MFVSATTDARLIFIITSSLHPQVMSAYFLLVEIHIVGGFQQQVVVKARRHALDLVRPSELVETMSDTSKGKRENTRRTEQKLPRNARERDNHKGGEPR